jgi:hypothetical protein
MNYCSNWISSTVKTLKTGPSENWNSSKTGQFLKSRIFFFKVHLKISSRYLKLWILKTWRFYVTTNDTGAWKILWKLDSNSSVNFLCIKCICQFNCQVIILSNQEMWYIWFFFFSFTGQEDSTFVRAPLSTILV